MKKTKILVVDDEAHICEFAKRFLTRRNYDVCTAEDATAAIELVKKENPAIVLLDINIGSVSGLDVLKEIKVMNNEMKVIMVTAHEDMSTIVEAKNLGADDYITKPFTGETLERMILQKISLLAQRQMMRNPSGSDT